MKRDYEEWVKWAGATAASCDVCGGRNGAAAVDVADRDPAKACRLCGFTTTAAADVVSAAGLGFVLCVRVSISASPPHLAFPKISYIPLFLGLEKEIFV